MGSGERHGSGSQTRAHSGSEASGHTYRKAHRYHHAAMSCRLRCRSGSTSDSSWRGRLRNGLRACYDQRLYDIYSLKCQWYSYSDNPPFH